MNHLLRIIVGAQAGRTVKLDDRTTFGRAADCDVQLLDANVSRHHARMAITNEGVELTDLASTNGTLVNGRAVRQIVLSAGDRIELSGTRFRYEPDPRSAGGRSTFIVQRARSSARSLRRTETMAAVDEERILSAAMSTRITAPHVAVARLDLRTVVSTRQTPFETDNEPRPGRPAALAQLDASDTLLAIARYRAFCSSTLRGSQLGTLERGHFNRIKNGLLSANEAASCQRRFARFVCQLSAQLDPADGVSCPVIVSDIGGGGARLEMTCEPPPVDCTIWLAVALPLGVGAIWRGGRIVRFEARVAWRSEQSCGIAFVGAPGKTATPG